MLGDDAVDGRVAAQVATIHADHLSESGATLIEYELAGDADAALVEREFAHASMAANEGKLAVVGPEVVLDSGIGIGVREDDAELKEKLDRAIAAMKEDGSLNALIRKSLDADADRF